jgi:Protein of unknown function (DUF2919)
VQDSAYLDVTSHGVLRVPGPLWLGFALMARYWILMLVVAVSARRSKESVLLLGHDGVPWVWLAMQLPIVLLMLAAAQRVPSGGGWARALWRQGRPIITLTALLNLAWTARLLWLSDDWAPWPELALASFCLIDLAITLAVWRDKFFAQLFSEFPAPEEKAGSKA